MLSILKYVLLLPFWAICTQFYFHAIAQKAEQKQQECRAVGIIFTSIGIVSLVSRDIIFGISGLILIMLGLRMIAYGLDRIDKKVFIDRYEE